jgi:hypothetical protein
MRYRWILGHGWLYLLSWKNHHGMMNNWRLSRILHVGGVVTIVIPSVSIKDRTIVGTSVEIECMPLT